MTARSISMSSSLMNKFALRVALVLLLSFVHISLTVHLPSIDGHVRDMSISEEPPNSSVLGHTRSQTGAPCSINILFFGVIPYWMEVSRRKRWVRNVLAGTRVDCYEETCSVRVSYTKRPQNIVNANILIFTDTSPEWISHEVWDTLIELRPPGQRWVMSTQETPPYVPGLRPPEVHRLSSYDWTNTYRSDSTFPEPYGYYRLYDHTDDQKHDRRRRRRLDALIKGKRKSVAWISSHCNALEWDRPGFVEAMREYIPVDTYGDCGDNDLPWKRRDVLRRDLEPYTFYLSFENSCCDQYITEKFWKSLDFGMIPVVVGAPLQHYLDVAPPDSFIHVDQFESLEEMVDYMSDVGQDPDKLRKHLKWRLEGEVLTEELWDHILRPMGNTTLCSMARKFKQGTNEDSTIRDGPTDPFDFYGANWETSCHSCATKPWMEPYQNRRP